MSAGTFDETRADRGDYSQPATALDAWAPVFLGTQVWAKNLSLANAAVITEWFDFLRRRAERDAALPKHFAECKGPDDGMRVTMEFLRMAVDDYQKEYAELVRLGGMMAGETMSALHPTRSDTADVAEPNRRSS